MTKKVPICVDFDGTIVTHEYPLIGMPLPGAIEWMKKWQSVGGQIILFTMRSGASLDEAVTYLQAGGIELHGINRNPTQHNWTSSPKAYGAMYVDDAAIGCPLTNYVGCNRPGVDWSIVGPLVFQRLLDTQKG